MTTESGNASAGRIEIRDIDEYQQFTPPWEVILRQMSPGQFSGRMEYVQVNGILLYREHWSHRVIATGATPAGFFTFGGPSSPRTRIDWCGSELSARCLAFGRSSSEVDFVLPEDSHHVVLLAPNRLLERYLGEELAATALRDDHFLRSRSGCGNQLLDMIDRLIDKYLARRELLAEERVRMAIEWQLMGSLTEVVLSSHTNPCYPAPRKRYSAFHRAVEYFENLDRPVAVPQLAAAAGVSQRVLELAFREAAGITPRRYMRWSRLNQVRWELLAADADLSSVTTIAGSCGITELGRFAVEYKRLFGESPSTTLARNAWACPKTMADALRESPSR